MLNIENCTKGFCNYCPYPYCVKERKQSGFEHFVKLVKETPRRYVYVSTKGLAYTIDKQTNQKRELKRSLHDGKIRLCLHGWCPELKRLVWEVATGKRLTTGDIILPIDGDETNLTIENLKKITKREMSANTGWMSRNNPVVVIDYKKAPVEYRSVRAAAKALYVSYQTLLDYLSGKYKSSVLKKYGRKIYYKNDGKK